jgi:AmiR/NasT family two-component response regulator
MQHSIAQVHETTSIGLVADPTELARVRSVLETLLETHAQEVAQLREHAAADKVIGQAIGVLMAQYRLNEGAAFEVLRRRSSSAGRQVRDLARQTVDEANSLGRLLRPVADC